MKLSKKSRYGLRALIDLAVNSKDGHVALNSIALRNNISAQYLEQVFASLRRAGIVRSVKGPQGGYLLNYEANQITVADILEALEGGYRLEEEESSQLDNHGISSAIQVLLIDAVNEQLTDLLTKLTLADLESYYTSHREYEQDMYYI